MGVPAHRTLSRFIGCWVGCRAAKARIGKQDQSRTYMLLPAVSRLLCRSRPSSFRERLLKTPRSLSIRALDRALDANCAPRRQAPLISRGS